jgi:antitoxin HicB
MATVFTYPATIEETGGDGRLLVRFRDLPEALTDGATLAEALDEAEDCLAEALAARLADGTAIPAPGAATPEEFAVPVEAALALKIALVKAMADRAVTAAEVARRMGVDHKEVRRMLDPRHPTKVGRLSDALRQLGMSVTTAVVDPARRERLQVTAPVAARRRPAASRRRA